jgi:molybdopterin synthase sulfur carrier subunit
MARLHFTPNLERHLGLASLEVQGSTLAEALEHAFSQLARARGYLMDDQGQVRHHVAVFVDGVLVQDRVRLSLPIAENSEIWLMQALSGG